MIVMTTHDNIYMWIQLYDSMIIGTAWQ